MNLFVTSTDPEECAKALDDEAVSQMTEITAKMVGMAAHRVYGQDKLFEATFENHPINIWLRQDDHNYIWTCQHFFSLCNENLFRFERKYNARKLMDAIMRSFSVIERRYKAEGKLWIHENPARFVNCAHNKALGISYQHISDVPKAYQEYLKHRWNIKRNSVKWSGRQQPLWLNN